jgi:O-acetyl-ADP-ribose deacetylase (regulator of RNase III)
MAQTSHADIGSTRIDIEQQDITRFSADAIVNAANAELAGGGGVDGAIHRAAGPSVMTELRGKYTGCPTGSAVITAAGELAAQHIIHAVGPVWRGGTHGEADDLASAFRTSLDLAQAADATSIAFPALSCGVYGYPVEKAAPVSVGAVRDWLASHPETSLRRITFVVRGDETLNAFSRAIDAVASARPN